MFKGMIKKLYKWGTRFQMVLPCRIVIAFKIIKKRKRTPPSQIQTIT